MSLCETELRANTSSPCTSNEPWRGAVCTGGTNLLQRALALAGLVVLSPLLAVLMVVIRLTSAGPALYAQRRLGLGGRIFWMYKLRSMDRDSEQYTGPIWASPDDPRVTPFGRFLRYFHLDELPQLVNIVRGEMNFVGPRPERPELAERLREHLPHYDRRLLVKPGITGLAQIRLPSDTTVDDVRRKLRYDLLYVCRASAWLDLQIVWSTLPRLTGRRPVWARRRKARRATVPPAEFLTEGQVGPLLAARDQMTAP